MLAPGQRGLIPIISPLREQSQEILSYIRGLAALPQVKRALAGEPTRDTVSFRTGIEIKVMTCDAVNVSGPTVVCAILDEFAKWPGVGSAMPESEVLDALRPALAPVRGAPRRRLIGITSAFIREGAAYEVDRDNYGREGADVLVVRGNTEQFNPNIDRAWLARERRRVGEQVYRREYEAQWSDSAQGGFFDVEAIARSIRTGNAALGVPPGVRPLVALDAAFSKTGDLFGWAVGSHHPGAYSDDGRVRSPSSTIVHACGAWRVDGSPRDMACRVAELCSRFGVDEVCIDQYGDELFRTLLGDVGVRATTVRWSAGDDHDSKATRYRSFRTAMQAGAMHLPDVAELRHDLGRCRSELLPGGSEKIEVPRTKRGHGDCLAAVVLAATEAQRRNASAPLPQKIWDEFAAIAKAAHAAVTAATDGIAPRGSAVTSGSRSWTGAWFAEPRQQQYREIAPADDDGWWDAG